MSSLPRFFSEGILANIVGSSQNQASPPTGISRSFELFIQNINKVSNKYEEQQIVERELQSVQQSISNPSISQVQLRDFLTRIIYCHMLGYDVSWGHIHAVKLAQQGTQLYKKIGYLTCCLLLHRDHDLILLLINTIQKDLKSSNLLDNVAALAAASQLVPSEMIPALLPVVLEKLKHPRVMVRQGAVMCLHQFYLLVPDLLQHSLGEVHRVLLDKDPGVVATYLHILQYDIQRFPEKHKSTGTILVKILNQLTTVRMDPMFDYHGVPFPWLRIHLIRCLSKLATIHESLRKDVETVLETVLQRLNLKENIGYALLYECIQCVLTIDPGRKLLDDTAKHVGRFLKSNDPNLKLIGVKALVRLVQADKKYAADYQDLIVQSLEHSDTGVQRKMYKVLFQISHAGNVEAIAAQMLHQLVTSLDRYWRSEVIAMVTDIANRFPDNAVWQVDTLYRCLQLGDREITPAVTNLILDMLQQGYMSDGVEVKRQQVLVQKSVAAMMSREVTPCLVQISSWVLGELCRLLKNISEEKLLGMMIKHLCNTQLTYPVKSYVLCAIQKLLGTQLIGPVSMATNLRECLKVAQPPVVKQRMVMLLGVCQRQVVVQPCRPDVLIDTTLSFLDDMVADHLEQGRSPYIPVHMRGMAAASQSGLSVYEGEPQAGVAEGSVEEESENLSVEDRPRTGSTTSSVRTADDREVGLKLSGVRQVWSKQGRLSTAQPTTVDTLSQEQRVSEDERRYKELSSALFAGLPSREKNFPEEPFQEDSAGFLSNPSDEGGWRKLHESNKTDRRSSYCSHSNALSETSHSEHRPQQTIVQQFDSSVAESEAVVSEALDEMPREEARGLEVEESGVVISFRSVDEESGVVNSFQSVDISQNSNKTEDELSSLMNDNSGFLNISVCSQDESRVSLSFIGEDFPDKSLGEVNIMDTSNHRLKKHGTDTETGISKGSETGKAGNTNRISEARPKQGCDEDMLNRDSNNHVTELCKKNEDEHS